MAALYLASKLEECPLRIRDLINVYDLLQQRATHSLRTKSDGEFKYAPMSYFGNTFYDIKDAIVVHEMQLLKRLGFNVQVVLPYGTLINYLKVLGLTEKEDVCKKAWGYLNDALQTPVYALYQIPTIVCAAIFLAARHLRIALPLSSNDSHCWWDLFDADYQDMWSVCGYVMRLYRKRSDHDRVRVVGMISKKGVRKWLEEAAVEEDKMPG